MHTAFCIQESWMVHTIYLCHSKKKPGMLRPVKRRDRRMVKFLFEEGGRFDYKFYLLPEETKFLLEQMPELTIVVIPYGKSFQ